MNRELFFSEESARLYLDNNIGLSIIECIALAEMMHLETNQSTQGIDKNHQGKYITK